MKKAHLAALVFAAVLCSVYGESHASFHSGATGKCEGCHAFGGTSQYPAAGAVPEQGRTSLRGSDPSSTCLICHEPPPGAVMGEAHFVSTASGIPGQLTPGGDFGWLKKNYRWRGEGGAIETSQGEKHGHNIVAADYGYHASQLKPLAPGGNYASAALSCISCHDPHGNYRRNADGSISTSGAPIIGSGSYNTSPNPDANGSVGSYRLLAGKGYKTQAQAGQEFLADPPAAVAPAQYNRSESATDTRVAYGSGMSEWCQNCHGQIHASNGTQHVSGNNAQLSFEIIGNYNDYVKSGNLNGSVSESYSSLVPYEMGSEDYTLLKRVANSDGSNLSGPGANGDRPNVMCLSCHRAHASGWDGMTRWNMEATFIVENGAYPSVDRGGRAENAQGRSASDVRAAFYDRPASRFAVFQRSLCNKCHARD